MRKAFGIVGLVFVSIVGLAKSEVGFRTKLPPGYWTLEQSQALLDKTQTIRLAPDLTHLNAGERKAILKLLEVGQIFQRLYEEQRHVQAEAFYRDLVKLDRRTGNNRETQNLLSLYRLFQGPIATTLENRREPFLPVDPVQPGKNVFAWGVKRDQIEAFLSSHPAQRDQILNLRTVVRLAIASNITQDLAVLKQHPVLDILHPELRANLQAKLAAATSGRGKGSKRERGEFGTPQLFYAVPYSVAYAKDLIRAYMLLNQAAEAIAGDDQEFAGYLRNRARDLLSNDYESGDASWVTGQFKNLNAQIGPYETYDDELYGVKTFFAFSLLSARRPETLALREAMKGLQALEDSLPYDHHKKVREDIPVGVYDVIADFGQARGGNTATILPNESYLARRYGRTILLRANIMRDPNIFASSEASFEAVVGAEAAKDLTSDGNFYRTLWHEVGHYLGVDRTKDNRDLDEALEENASALEEMKADLVSLFVAAALRKQGYYTDAQLKSLYAGGILRVLQNNKPRRDQPYNTMQLMQWNFFLENGLLGFKDGRLRIDYDKYHEVVGRLLRRVLDVQYQGDKAASDQFIQQYTSWDENLHGVIAKNIRDRQKYRFRIFKYAALGE